jgi:DNA polymerase I
MISRSIKSMSLKYIQEDISRLWAIDIETDDVNATIIWCLCAVKADTNEEVRLRTPETIRSWIDERKSEGCRFIGHNIIGFDAYQLNRLLGCKLTIADLIDTMVSSMVFSPSIADGHSLHAWGVRLRFPKTEWNDFSKWSKEQEDYCLNDAKLCLRVYFSLIGRMQKINMSDVGLEIEHRSWQLIQVQKRNGFAFNYPEAMALYSKVRSIENDIGEEVLQVWPPVRQVVWTSGAKAHKKDGNPSANYTRHFGQYPLVEVLPDGRYQCYDDVSFNIGSSQQRIERLLALGWKPGKDELTKAGNPQPIVKGKLVPTLEKFVEESDNPGVRLIAKWMDYNARGNMLNTWIEAYNADTGCIHGSLWLANTLRYRHSDPNTANIPAVRVDKQGKPLFAEAGVYTYEARNLWTSRCRKSRLLVGVDAKGIQLRVLAHYLNNLTFTEAVLNGDPHSYNQEIGGFAARSIAKTFIYAFLLGAGDAKVGQIISGTTAEGKAVKARFVSNFPGLGDLLDDLAGQVDRTGRIVLCDGTPVIVDRPHTRLGYLLQGDESRIMKKAAILLNVLIKAKGLDALKVGDIHDEWQFDVLKEHVDEFIACCVIAFRDSGKFFNYRLPIDCDTKVGNTWAETH